MTTTMRSAIIQAAKSTDIAARMKTLKATHETVKAVRAELAFNPERYPLKWSNLKRWQESLDRALAEQGEAIEAVDTMLRMTRIAVLEG